MERFALILSILVIALGSPTLAQTSQSKEATPSTAEPPQVTPQQGQSAAQQRHDLAECYDIAKAKTGVDPRALAEATGGKVNIPGMPSAPNADSAAAAAGTPGKDAPSADKKLMLDKFQLANQGCLQARGYIIKNPAAPAPPPKH
jgi:hypothetical protein